MFLISVIVVLSVLACDPSKNDPITQINEDCNNAGVCEFFSNPFGADTNYCKCCAPEDLVPGNVCGDHWVCDPNDPWPECMEFEGATCKTTQNYYYVGFGFRALESNANADPDIICNTDPQTRAETGVFDRPSIYFHEQVQYVIDNIGWNGGIEPSPVCDSCSPAYPCTVGTDSSKNVTTGNTFGFQADFNEFYNLSCATGGVIYSLDGRKECLENYDYGQRANQAWDIVSGDSTLLDNLNDLLWAAPEDSNDNLGLSWSNTRMIFLSEQLLSSDFETEIRSPTENPTEMPTESPTIPPTNSPTTSPTTSPTDSPTQSPTQSPTAMPSLNPTPMPTHVPTNSPTLIPTASPTPMPTQTPSYDCDPFANNVDDLSFVGVGSNCRGGLNSSYPGGFTCDSPYVICLPQENTPAALGDQAYKNSTHRYSVDECLKECANDQRCSGIEFVADPSSPLGDCNLIDDIPVVITSMVSSPFEYDSSMMYSSLDNATTGADSICFQKEDYCNPFFEAEDLTDHMLNCYCPNNRKGFYTKKVKRTVENSRFCGNDTEVDIRIQKAQANRMFHLCENWCLFLTEDPESESWYYDPWNACFREQYVSGAGVHRGYCHRVIISPDTIEMKFINNRVQLSCQNATNATAEDY